MTSVTFSYLDHLSGLEFLNLSKRYAKTTKNAGTDGKALSWHQDQIAISLGFKNWSMLHKYFAAINWCPMDQVFLVALSRPGLGDFIHHHAVRTIDKEQAVETMKDWARANYTPLIEFAYHDSESPTGYSWPDVDMAYELSEEFSGRFPDDLIQDVGNDLDVDQGPWGLEDFGDDLS